ncbi:MAG TPA: hypothetical protein VGD79_03100 [Thermoanaerobaculia bacterium]|jgi:hypothetical protein
MATTNTIKKTSRGSSDCGCGCGGGGCPSCKGLECLERPRYFAGQLLTEAELNSEQAYVIAKNRLHNRYLHGWGVVCGLEVVCSSCDGWVHIREGYAIDPCGNDIIVCRGRDFNVIEAINKCLDAKRSRYDDCPPWQDPNADCKDDEEQWCITLEYDELQTKSTLPLRQEGTSSCNSGSGCGCGGNGKKKAKTSSSSKAGCGCGGGCGDAPAPPKSNARGVACEPTRILEGYKLGVICQPQSCRDVHKVTTSFNPNSTVTPQVLATSAGSKRFGSLSEHMLRALVPKEVLENRWVLAGLKLEDESTLFANVLATFTDVEAFLGDYLTPAEMDQITAAFDEAVKETGGGKAAAPQNEAVFTTGANAVVTQQRETLCCRFRRALRELYVQNPLNVRCSGFDCPPCSRDPQAPGQIDREAILCLVNALVDYIVGAVCLKLLPPCPPTPCDNRLILACVTVRNGKIVHICNFACRHYAGSFNSLMYWTSIVPVVSIISQVVRRICCAPSALRAILGGDETVAGRIDG